MSTGLIVLLHRLDLKFIGYVEKMVVTASQSKGTMVETHSLNFPDEGSEGPSLCIAVIGATGELAKGKIFPALFALYYSGFLPEVGLV